MDVARVAITEEAGAVLRGLVEEHGPLLFHQSGGCCDGSSPMCFPRGEFRVGQRDVLLGELEGTPFYIGGAQFEVWQHTQLLIDVVPGCGSGFSLEARLGSGFSPGRGCSTRGNRRGWRRAGRSGAAGQRGSRGAVRR